MIRLFFFAVLLCSVFITGGLTPPRSCAAELSLAQKEELLDKAQAALIWFHSLGDESVRNRTDSETYREQITLIELIQAAAILCDTREEEQITLAKHLCLMLPYFRVTPEESFEIHDVLGEAILRQLSDIEVEVLGKIPVEAARFRSQQLNNAEKIVLYQEPATALELIKAVDVLSVVGRPVLVRYYLRKFLSGGQYTSTPEESAKIVETIGTQKLMQLAINPDFVPLGKEAVAKIIDEAKKHWQNDEKIAEALKETDWFVETADEPRTLESGRVQVHPEALPALKILWKGDQLSVQQVFEKLATVENEQEADQLLAVLLSIRADMKEALTSAIGAANGRLRYHAARGLAASVTPMEAFLLYQFVFNDDVSEAERATVKNILQQRRISLPSQEQAATILFERATDYFEKRRPLRVDTNGKVSFWDWIDEGNGGNIEYQSWENIEAAYKHFAAAYYRQSYRIAPKTSANYKTYRMMFEIAILEYSGYIEMLVDMNSNVLEHKDSWLRRYVLKYDGTAESFTYLLYDPNIQVEDILQKSLEKNCFHAASIAVFLLSFTKQIGGDDLFKAASGKPRPLVQAVASKNRDVRFAALVAIMKLNPTEPFAGSSLVADTLVWFSKSDGESVLLSGHPKMASAVQTANLFLGDGYKTEIATTCRELFQLAAASPDVELVVIDAHVSQPPVGEFVQAMWQNPKTADIPIAILSDSERSLNPNVNAQRRNIMTRFDRRNPGSPFQTSLSLTYPRPASEKSARWIRDDLNEKTGVNILVPDTRLQQAHQTLIWLREIKEAELSESSPKIYHFDDFDSVVLDALHSERRVVEGLKLARVVKSADIQLAIYEMAANVIYPMELRKQAGETFEQSVQRFGVLLRGNQIQRLYDRYNQSETEPKESQELLNRLIDVLEQKVLKK